MDLDDGNRHGSDGIPQSNAVVRIGGSIQDDELIFPLRPLHGVHQRALMIRLKEIERQARLIPPFLQDAIDVR